MSGFDKCSACGVWQWCRSMDSDGDDKPAECDRDEHGERRSYQQHYPSRRCLCQWGNKGVDFTLEKVNPDCPIHEVAQ